MIESEIKNVDFLLNVIQDLNMMSDVRYRAYITVNGRGFYFQHPEMNVVPDDFVILYVDAYIEDQWTMIIDWKQAVMPNRNADAILLIFTRELLMQGVVMNVERTKRLLT